MKKPYQTYEREKSEALLAAVWTFVMTVFCTGLGITELESNPLVAGIMFLAAATWFACVVVRLDTWRLWRRTERFNKETWEFEEKTRKLKEDWK